MGLGDKEDSINDLTNNLPQVGSLMDEVNNEFMDSLLEGVLPKIKIFMPKVIKSIDENKTSVITQDEMIIITRSEEDGCVVVVRGNKKDIELHGDLSKCKVDDLSSVFNMLLDMIAKGGKR